MKLNSPLKHPIYLDYAATTPVDQRVLEAMQAVMTKDGEFANPSSPHMLGQTAANSIANARQKVAEFIGADSNEIVFTSGATEANNLALKGFSLAQRSRGQHIITGTTEHKAVLGPCRYLLEQGFRVTYLRPDSGGRISAQVVEEALRPDTTLVSLMWVNNETGVIQEIEDIGKLCRHHGIVFHVDAAQAVGRIEINLRLLPIDMLSFSAHKMYGPKGVGALYLRRDANIVLEPLLHGGGQERGWRAGTLPTHQIVGFGVACELASEALFADCAHAIKLRERLWGGLSSIPRVVLNSDPKICVPHIMNVSFRDVEGESLMLAIQPLAVGAGSACSSIGEERSHVLRAMGVSSVLADSSLRFSFGRFSTEKDIDGAITRVREAVQFLRKIAGQSEAA